MKKLILLLLFIPLVFSCSSDQIEESEINDESPVLVKSISVKFTEGNETLDGLERNIEFSYLDSKIISVKSPAFRNITSQFIETERLATYEYNENKISKVTVQDGSIIKFTREFQYQDDRLIKYITTNYRNDGSVQYLRNYNIQWEADYLSNTVLNEANNQVIIKNKFDSENNVIQAEYYGDILGTYKLYTTENLKYDSNKNPLFNITGASQLSQIWNLFNTSNKFGNGKNNYTEFNSDIDTDYQTTVQETFSYQYNSLGYPSSVEYIYKWQNKINKSIYTFNY